LRSAQLAAPASSVSAIAHVERVLYTVTLNTG
jgi:hypothetical protein